jgi:hypothetical protein
MAKEKFDLDKDCEIVLPISKIKEMVKYLEMDEIIDSMRDKNQINSLIERLFHDYKIEIMEKVQLSPYNLAHNEIGDCCGIFNMIDENGIIYCNECGETIHDSVLKTLK